MSTDLHKLEQEIDAGLRSIGAQLDVPALRPAVLDRIRAAVRAEAVRMVPGRRGVRRAAAGTALAAAAAIALVMILPRSNREIQPDSLLDAPLSLSDWVLAARESGDQITMLLEGDWNADFPREPDARHDPLDEALDSLEDSLSAMESVFGA